jgi:hypothetical protein
MGAIDTFLDRWFAVGVILHTVIMDGLLSTVNGHHCVRLGFAIASLPIGLKPLLVLITFEAMGDAVISIRDHQHSLNDDRVLQPIHASPALFGEPVPFGTTKRSGHFASPPLM